MKKLKIVSASGSPLGGHNSGRVDTSLLYEELKREYAKTGQELNVSFRALASWVKPGDQLTHQIHPYPAKLLPHIVHFFANASCLSKPGEIILDPFCGSGTVALEASLAGKIPCVADANPLARLITKVKTYPYDPTHLRAVTIKIINKAKRYRVAPKIDIVNSELWYSPQRKKRLELIFRAIQELDSIEDKDFFNVCFSILARKFSNADPAISVPVRLKEKSAFSVDVNNKIKERIKWIEIANVTDEFYKICEQNIYRVEITNHLFPDRVEVRNVGEDARNLKGFGKEIENTSLADNSIFLTITSPPYGSAQKYIRSTSLSLNWLGLASVSDLAILDRKSIGREHIYTKWNEINRIIPVKYQRLVEEISEVNSERAAITKTYFCEMSDALYEIARVTAPGGHIVLVLGNNSVSGRVVRNDHFVIDVLNEIGFRLELSLVDGIHSRGLMTKRNKTASIISKETILVFSKVETR
ncbi:class I SAM-dependent methyltransferase [Methylovorus mays]|uniref:hypothetical protein n=1 Tax=Methylovorus mays TaxID=184077 RepID=UPI001E4A767F|nr:hypothetical protein [Methylovorus mays]MCB5206704.1 hypothetical protein [Methylovorus mays]